VYVELNPQQMFEKQTLKNQLSQLGEVLISFIGFLIISLLIGGVLSAFALMLFFDVDFMGPVPEKQEPIQVLVSQINLLVGVLLTTIIFDTPKGNWLRFFAGQLLNTRGGEFGMGALTSLFVIGSSIVVMVLLGVVQLDFNSLAGLITSIPIFLLISINEEIVCRGFLLRKLRASVPLLPAVPISSLLFAGLHVFNPHFSTIGFVSIFLSGIVLGLLYIKTVNLSAPIGAHFLWNLLQEVMGFAVSGHVPTGVFSATYLSESVWLTGGKFGLEGSVITALFTFCLLLFMLPKRQTR
jgi:membrane protease YdiL (CAAX protease family)